MAQAKQYTSLREKIAAEKRERAERYAGFAALFDNAARIGFEAGRNADPAPMAVYNPASDKTDVVSEGPCGFAWVTIRPGNGSFARFLVKENLARRAYYGGVEIWISAHNQSYARKMENARAMAQHLRNAGIEAFPGGRLD